VSSVASSGEEAIKKATEISPKLVIMDIRLKGDMDGVQAAETIWNSSKFQCILLAMIKIP